MVSTLLQRLSMTVSIRQPGKTNVSIPCIHTDIPLCTAKTKYSLFCETRKSFHFKCTIFRDVAAVESDIAAASETPNTNTASKHATG